LIKTIKNKSLVILIQVISISFLLSSCQPTTTDRQAAASQSANANVSLIEINETSANQIIDYGPREYFTDYGSPFYCALSEKPALVSEPLWIEPQNVWQRIRLGYQLDWGLAQKRIDAEFNWYQRNPSYMARVSQRAERYIFHVVEQLEQQQLPLELALLPIVESAYDPFAYSHGRASGMWQFIPSTGYMYNLNINWWFDGRRDIVASTTAAASYLKKLSDYYDGDWLLALAAYNSGQGNVNKAIRKNKKRNKPTDFWSLDLPRETRSYVPKLLALAKLVNSPNRYGVTLYPVANKPYFAVVNTQSQIDLAEAANWAGISIDELYLLNPAFNRWATAPDGPHRLLVPIANKDKLEWKLSQLEPEDRLHWQRYTVKKGDSLLLLAKRFSTGVDTIKQINDLRGNMIRAGQKLMIPTASATSKHYSMSAEQRLANIQSKRTGGSDSKQIFHKVKSGDSLWTIAQRYKVTSSKIAHWNGIAPKDTLKIGQKLSVWVNAKTASTAQPAKRDAMVRKLGYKVRNGDSLARIAQKFNVGINDIVKWNSVNPKKYLQPGQRLTLYVDITNAIN
jgi:membrane-bound lytic murein transglycosylase D